MSEDRKGREFHAEAPSLQREEEERREEEPLALEDRATVVTRPADAPGARPGGEPAGGRIGDCRILRPIGRGGMGRVYQAIDALERTVAVKIMSGEMAASRDFRERFRREYAKVARIAHPNIARIHAVGSHEGLPYFVMEYVDG